MIDRIMHLNPVSYRFRSAEYASLRLPVKAQMGFIAQEIQGVFPELVNSGQTANSPDGESFNIQTVGYIKLIPALTAALQEMHHTQLELRQQIVRLKQDLSTLKHQVSR